MAEARAPEPKQLNEAQVARTIAERDRIGFALFLGAGASKSSGVLLVPGCLLLAPRFTAELA